MVPRTYLQKFFFIWYHFNVPFPPKNTTERILSALRGPSPPQNLTDLAAAVNLPLTNLKPRISILIKKGKLHNNECPWRAQQPFVPASILGTDNPNTDAIVAFLRDTMNAGGKDAVTAAGKLYEILQSRGETRTENVPGDVPAIIDALSRQMTAAGNWATKKAYRIAFRPQTAQAPFNPSDEPDAPSASDLGGHLLPTGERGEPDGDPARDEDGILSGLASEGEQIAHDPGL